MDDCSSICSPISDINNVFEWKCDGNCWIHKHGVSDLNRRTEFLNSGSLLDLRKIDEVFPEYKLPSTMVPKTIFCHDYKGGYIEDRFCNGSTNIETYRFFNWSVIDLFIYFSHKLVTIPPQGWINAGHKHGVPVLGTLITEWNDGEKIWTDILSDVHKLNLFSQKLAEICAHFKFDGYLLNVENKIPINLVPRLIDFVALFKSHLNLYCKRQTWLLWYDSVTVKGTLDWQNKLCTLNRAFFDACDGIFLNYVWTPAGLMETLKEAGDRKFEVYVGVDVWGRNCYYNGGFNVDKALGVLRSLNMSVAIFAPGWTFEAAPKEQFMQRELMFWKQISPYLYVHGPTGLPFSTNFCQGIRYQESGSSLFNLSDQEYQPEVQACTAHDSCISMQLGDEVPLNGTCLKIKAACQEHSKLFHRIFACDFSGSQQDSSSLYLLFLITNSVSENATKFQVFFIVEDKLSIEGRRAVNMCETPKGYRSNVQVDGFTVVASVMDFTAEKQTEEVKIKGYYDAVPSSAWQHVTFKLELAPNTSLTEILVLPPSSGCVLWGGLYIDTDKPPVTISS